MNENELSFNNFVDNYINGNLSYCQKEVYKFDLIDLRQHFIDYAGYSLEKSIYIIDYLTTGKNYQLACDTD